ncbi:c-type cytochrome, partial [Psychrobacter sp. 1U2]
MRLLNISSIKIGQALSSSMVALVISIAMTSSHAATDISKIYNDSCAACHDSGALNAIKKGDSAQWQRLIERKGMPALIDSVKGGMIQMPAGGLCD